MEDKLQDDVPKTIDALREAGIKVHYRPVLSPEEVTHSVCPVTSCVLHVTVHYIPVLSSREVTHAVCLVISWVFHIEIHHILVLSQGEVTHAVCPIIFFVFHVFSCQPNFHSSDCYAISVFFISYS